MTTSIIYKIMSSEEWQAAEMEGRFIGSAVDIADGFIHFSTGAQAVETARRHFAGRDGLVLVSVDAVALAAVLKWEPSRGGDLFPHLYQPLDLAMVRGVAPLPLLPGGEHQFPELF